MTQYRKKLIEVALPLPEINDASAYDKMPGIGPHPKGIHHWWARLPLPTARAVLFASVVDDPSGHPDRFPTDEMRKLERERLFDILRSLMQKKLHDHPEVYAAATAEMLKYCDGKLPAVYDPFAGGGSIPLEANRMGFEAHAADLNPVAVLLNKCNLEIAPRWANMPPVNQKDRANIGGSNALPGTRGLAADVRHYGTLIGDRAKQKIGQFYPQARLPKEMGGTQASVIAWLWTRTIKCPNPACGARMPLVRSFSLSKKKGKGCHAAPIVNQLAKTVRFQPQTEGSAHGHTTDRNGARCLFCNTFVKKPQLREVSLAHGVHEIPFGVVVETKNGRLYLSSDSYVPPDVPKPESTGLEQPITNDRRWFSPPLYGLPLFADLFTSRQLLALTTISDLVKQIVKEVAADATLAGLATPDATAYANAVVTFLALAVDRCADFNNSLCTWSASNEKVMHLFGRQAIPMVWDFAEANILGESVGAWHTCSEYVADCIEVLTAGSMRTGQARQIDAATGANGLTGILVSTDPPYYDNIGYAALSDFFYVLLRRTIGSMYAELCSTVLVPKMPELTASAERFEGNRLKAREHFEVGFRKAFTALRDKMDPRFPLTVYYAFKQDDETAGAGEDGDSPAGIDLTTGWETLLEALHSSGFEITGTWPVRASQQWRMVAMGTNALASYIVLACRLRPNDSRLATRKEVINALREELPTALRNLQYGNIAPVDFAQAAIGPGMAVFTRYARVIESDGTPMTVRTALSIINQVLDEVLAEQEGDFDADTRWALAWFEQFGTSEESFGVAETLSRAKNTAVNGLVEAGIVKSRGGKVRLLTRAELPDDWDPVTDNRVRHWEVVQHLIRALQTKGEAEAAKLLNRLGGMSETARELAYRLYSICERKKWPEEALAYNSLVIAWPELSKLALSTRIRQPDPQSELFS